MPRGVPGSTPLCSLPSCTRPNCAKGLCRTHYMRHSRGLPLDNPIPRIRRPNEAPEPCAVPGCQAPSRTANIGPCSMHYERQRAGRPLDAPRRRARGAPPLPCEVAGRDRPARKLKLCGMHYQRLRNSGNAGSAESRIDEAIIAQNRMLAGSGQKACSGCKQVLPDRLLLSRRQKPRRRNECVQGLQERLAEALPARERRRHPGLPNAVPG
jgi:hypothetical protein